MHTQKSNDLVLISITSPILCGIYQDGECVEVLRYEEKTLNALTKLLEELKERNITRIFYAKGPGSFTAIKLTHLFLQTLSIIKGIELFSVNAFYFNANSPIKAFGNQYFIKEGGEIILQTFQTPNIQEFTLPSKLREEDFGKCNEPLYILPPV